MADDTHELDSEPGGFPLNIDLSSFVGAPARCRVWVRARGHKVRWLASRVRRVAWLRGPLLLMAGECILPPGEPLRLIQPDDIVSVVRVEHKWQHPFSFNEDEGPTESAAVVESTSPAKLLSTEPTPLEEPSQPAKQKHIAQEPVVEEQPTVKPALKRQHARTPTTELTSEKPMQLVGHETLDRVKQRALALLEQVAGEEIEQDVVDAPKKKRRRVRRRRPCRDVNLDMSVEAESGSLQNGSQLQAIPNSNQKPHPENPQEEMSNGEQNGSALPQSPQSILTPSDAVSLSMTSVSAVPSQMILTYPTPSVLVRNQTPPRAPRVVRALTAEPLPKMEAALVSTS